MLRKPDAEIVIRGYTDALGSADYNRNLSAFRANVVKSYLVGKGVSPSRMKVVGMGGADPRLPNTTSAGRTGNRRVEIELVVRQPRSRVEALRTVERRHHSRVNSPLSVVLHTSEGLVNGEIWDIGPGGAFILCERQPAIEERVGIIFAGGQSADSVTIKGRVVRSTAEGVGVQFVELSDGERRFLNQVVTDSFRVEFGNRFVRRRDAVDGSDPEGTDEISP